MSANQTNARNNIVAALQTLPGISDFTLYRGVPDPDGLARYASGQIKPYGVIKFAGPIPTAQGRGAALTEDQQPQIMAIMFVAYAGSQEDAEAVAIAAADVLLGFEPDGANATALKAAGGYAFTSRSSANQPTRFAEAISFQTTMNMQVDGL